LPVRLLGISIDAPAASFRSKVIALAREAAQLAGLVFSEEELSSRMEVTDQFLGGGYAIVGELERDAIRLAARQEGLLLDPVYTARAFGGLCALLLQPSWRAELLAAAARDTSSPGRLPRVLFWHTGGVAALSAFSSVL
jgi:D-cysteine desulfhydrase